MLEEVDALIVPTVSTVYRIEETVGDSIGMMQRLIYHTNFSNLLDLCAIGAPSDFTSRRLPIDATSIAPTFHDSSLLAFAGNFEGNVGILGGN